jgi:glycosyltransferase involved in cell wall biosynthesis
LINKVKKVIPQCVKKIVKSLFKKKIKNFFKRTDCSKKVLISYITAPFKKQSLSHTNYYEVTCAAEIFNELGYQVDVMDFEGWVPNLDEYDVIYGFGDVFQKYFESGLSEKKTIYYGAGMHGCHQNTATLKRVKSVYKRKGKWIAKSARFVEKTWTHQTSLVDGIIALGNEECKKTYEKYYDGKVYSLPAPFFKTLHGHDVLKSRQPKAQKSFLWFGSTGLVHKGLDLCLDYFSSRPELNLHICGNILSEPEFVKLYKHELFDMANIHVHGFIDVASLKFKSILEKCSFTILPSCSEGGSPSVLTAIGNGAHIPLITKETSVSTGCEIEIRELSISGVDNAVRIAENLSDEEIDRLSRKNLEYVVKNHSQEVYYANLKFFIEDILNK